MLGITWGNFIHANSDNQSIEYKFEDLCRQLFKNEYLSNNKSQKNLHSNPNNPGIESEPILNEESGKYISYQVKFFERQVDYKQINKSAALTIKNYQGHLDVFYLFCNKPITTTCKSFKEIEKMLNDAHILIELITDKEILDLVRKYPPLAKYYFDDHHITHQWLADKAKVAQDIVGKRFNEDFNIDTGASRKLTIFLQNDNAARYFNSKKTNLIDEIKSLEWKLGNKYFYACKLSKQIQSLPDVDPRNVNDIRKWQNIILDESKSDIKNIEEEILSLQKELKDINEDDYKIKRLQSDLKKMEKIKSLYYQLELSKEEIKLLNSKVIIVEGEAGIGKTQLFANESVTLLNAGENALLIIGSDCLSKDNIFKQLEDNLRLDFKFEELIDILEVIGESSGKIIPIFIDALNESWQPILWKSAIPVLYQKVVEKSFVRLAISFRSEYEKTILPDNFLEYDDVMKIEHYGFKGNSLEAAKKFLDHYGIPFTPLHMFTSNINNPLFLTLYCKTYQGDEVELPILYERLLEKANDKMHVQLATVIENAGYDQSENIVLPIIESISKQILLTGKRHFERNEIVSMAIWHEMGLPAIPFIIQLIRENILHDYESNGKYYLYFTYDQMNDYFSAKTILSMFPKEDDIRDYIFKNILGIVDGKFQNWDNEGLFVHVCALYAEKYKQECIDIIANIKDETDKEALFTAYLESFEWRKKIYLAIPELLRLCNEYYIAPSILWRVFINNSVKQFHLLNADSLHNVLETYDLVKRDYLWTIFINEDTSNDNRLVQLIKSYNKGEVMEISDKEQIRLLLILFSWVLTSSNRWLRDTTSKAMIEILKVHFEYSEYLLKLFSKVNDPYVKQRLYGIVFGACTKRMHKNKEVYKSLVQYVFDDIFNKEIIYPDILLRDYARLIVERFIMEFPEESQNFDLKKIKPPYKSIPIPDIEDQNYLKQKFEKGLYSIVSSMRFEGMGWYGDFGRYVFQRALQNFEVDQHKIFNYAIYYIINELKYSGKLFDDYDSYSNHYIDRMNQYRKVERIGKKYQWITFYNIVARITDYYPKLKDTFFEKELDLYDGPWDPYVKDFDPTLNECNLFNKNAPHFSQVIKHENEVIQALKNEQEDEIDVEKWGDSCPLFFEYQKNDLKLIDDNGKEWIVLSNYADTGRNYFEHDKFFMWSKLCGYFVNEEQFKKLKEYIDKEIRVFNSEINEIPQTYILYNREYPWSSGSKALLPYQWIKCELKNDEIEQTIRVDEIQELTDLETYLKEYKSNKDSKLDNDSAGEINLDVEKKIIKKPVLINLGEMLNSTQELLWEEEFDDSKEAPIIIRHPCAEIINVLHIKQNNFDSYYYDENNDLVAFDTSLTKSKSGLVLRKDKLDEFLKSKNYHLVWFATGSKETNKQYYDWNGLLVYSEDAVEGDYNRVGIKD